VVILSSVLCHPSSASAAEQPSDTLAAPLSKTVARLAEQAELSAKDCAELASTTLTYGQRVKSAQQHPAEPVIRDALQGVDLGEKLDAKAADWPKLRADLEELLKREEQKKEDKKQDQKNEDQKKQDQQQKQDQPQSQDQKKNEQQKQDEQQQQKDQQQKQQQDAFGDMKDQKEQKPDQKPPPPKPGTQKVGGQQDKKPTEQVDPELAMPLQKLDQVRNQDSPAKLQQLMQGQQQKTKATGKDW
jgi:Ca-activated chloride channel family protein